MRCAPRARRWDSPVLVIDLAKGWLATAWLAHCDAARSACRPQPALAAWSVPVCALAVMLGHVYPVWFGFRGGKGVATLRRACCSASAPTLRADASSLTWLVAVMLFGFVGLGLDARHALAVALAVATGTSPPRAPLLTFALLARAPHPLYPPRQHRAHARGHRVARAAAVALRPAERLSGAGHKARTDAPARAPLIAQLFAALADGTFHSGEELAQGARGQPQRRVEGGRRAARARRGARRRAQPRLPARPPERAARGGADPRRSRPRGARPHREPRDRSGRSPPPIRRCWRARIRAAGTSEVLLAEFQSAGRGRRGRAWLAPPGAGDLPLAELDVSGGPAGARRARARHRRVRAAGAAGARRAKDLALKWPNDLLVGGRKLGGVLIELRAESAGPACVVIGIGLNVALGAELLRKIAATGVVGDGPCRARASTSGSRNAVVAGDRERVRARAAPNSSAQALKPFLEEWRAADALAGKAVNVSGAQGVAARCGARHRPARGAAARDTRRGSCSASSRAT